MLTAQILRGVIPAIVTPFDQHDRVDEAVLRKVTRYVADNGVHGIMTTGGTGEFPHLSRAERKTITAIVADELRGRLPVIAGTAACSTREAIELSQDAQSVGADGVIVTAPFYFRLPPASLHRHYADLAHAIDIPLILYNNPLYTGNPLSPSLIGDLARLDRVIGLKQSEPDFGVLVEVIRLAGDAISVCTGIDSQFYPALCMGARGIFSTAACVIPRQMVQVYDLVQVGEFEKARELHLKLQVLNRFLEYDPGYVSPCKEALELLGISVGHVRRPLPDLTEEERIGIRAALESLELL